MPILIRDEHLEQKIDRERRRRNDATQAKTLSDIARERLMQLEVEGAYNGPDTTNPDSPTSAEPVAKS